MPQQFISMKPAPSLVQAALDHCEIPLRYTDDGVSIKAGPGFDSNGNMTIPEGSELAEILSAVLTVAMVKHIEDTMVLPTNVSRLRQVASQLVDLRHAGRAEDAEWIDEIRDDILRVADNIDPANR